MNSRNSGLLSDLVDDVAIANDHIYFAHGLPDGKVSRLTESHTWTHFTDRKAAIVSDYAAILQTLNPNDTNLWTIRGDEVWAGYEIYDGSTWVTNKPSTTGIAPTASVVDSQHNLWSFEEDLVSKWDGQIWQHFYVPTFFTSTPTTLTVTASDVVWVGYQTRIGGPGPYGPECLSLAAFDPQQDNFDLQHATVCYSAPNDLIAIENDVWAVGAGYIVNPDMTLTNVDSPEHRSVQHVTLVENEPIVNSYAIHPYGISAVSTVNDNSTQQLFDDSWQVDYESPGNILDSQVVDEVTWARSEIYWRATVVHIGQFINGMFYSFGSFYRPRDFYATSASVVWTLDSDDVVRKRDTLGTPEDSFDDEITDFPLPRQFINGALAVSSDGLIYVGDESGVYLLEAEGLQPVYGDGVSDITLLPDGTVVARPIAAAFNSVVVSAPRDSGVVVSIADFVQDNFAELLATQIDNDIWHVHDDAVWYFSHDQIHRATENGVSSIELPFGSAADVTSWVVDANGQAWITANNALWRLSPSPDFAIDGTEKLLLNADKARPAVFMTNSIFGLAGDVALEIVGSLPDGITVDGLVASAEIGEPIQLTVSADQSLANGYYPVTLRASNGSIIHDHTFSIVIVGQLYENWLPAIRK